MSTLLVLAAWSGSGIAAAARLPTGTRLSGAWTPMAAILGPLFIPVAAEKRTVVDLTDPKTRDDATDSVAVEAEMWKETVWWGPGNGARPNDSQRPRSSYPLDRFTERSSLP